MGPAMAWPAARPSRQALSVSCVCEVLAPKSRLSDGRAGKYMSMDNGPKAVSAPRMITSCARRGLRGTWDDTERGWCGRCGEVGRRDASRVTRLVQRLASVKAMGICCFNG